MIFAGGGLFLISLYLPTTITHKIYTTPTQPKSACWKTAFVTSYDLPGLNGRLLLTVPGSKGFKKIGSTQHSFEEDRTSDPR